MSDFGSPPPPPPIFPAGPASPTVPSVQLPPRLPVRGPGSTAKSGRRVWLWWALGIGVVMVGGTLLLTLLNAVGQVTHLGARHSPGAAELTETILESEGGKDKIAVIPIEGVISGGGEDGGMVDLVRSQLERAAEDHHIKAVVLRIDTPGGEVLASDEIAEAIQEFQEGPEGKPVVVSMQSLCASGGYYISAPCRWIVAHELTITGSIGVIFHGYNYRALMDKVGVRPKTTKSGKLKDMWSPDKLVEEELPEEKAIMEEMVEESFNRFKKVIRDGRTRAADENQAWVKDQEAAGNSVEESDAGRTLGDDWESVADGRVMSGNRALEYGFVDEVGNFDVAVRRAKRLVGLDKANLVTFEPPVRFPNFLRLLGQSDVKTVKLDLGELGGLVPKLPQGRLYFMSPAFVH